MFQSGWSMQYERQGAGKLERTKLEPDCTRLVKESVNFSSNLEKLGDSRSVYRNFLL